MEQVEEADAYIAWDHEADNHWREDSKLSQDCAAVESLSVRSLVRLGVLRRMVNDMYAARSALGRTLFDSSTAPSSGLAC